MLCLNLAFVFNIILFISLFTIRPAPAAAMSAPGTMRIGGLLKSSGWAAARGSAPTPTPAPAAAAAASAKMPVGSGFVSASAMMSK